MPKDAIVSYLQKQNTEPLSQKLSEKLCDALRQYKFESEFHSLSEAYALHLANKQIEKANLNFQRIAKSFNSFNIAPSNSYQRYMAVLKNKSDYEAISSDWKTIGNDLRVAWAKHLLVEKENHER